MYVSKAMLNMRGDSFGSVANSGVEMPWTPALYTAYNGGIQQAGGSHISADAQAAIVFSAGDTIPDSVWNTMVGTLFSLNSLRIYLAINVARCTMDSAPISTGPLRIVNKGDGVRMFDMSTGALGRFTYAKPFNRMYLLIGNSVTAISGTSQNIGSVVEFTPQDLQKMSASLTDNNDGTFTLNSTMILNNISFG